MTLDTVSIPNLYHFLLGSMLGANLAEMDCFGLAGTVSVTLVVKHASQRCFMARMAHGHMTSLRLNLRWQRKFQWKSWEITSSF